MKSGSPGPFRRGAGFHVTALVALPYDFSRPSYASTKFTRCFQNDIPPSPGRFSVSTKVPFFSSDLHESWPVNSHKRCVRFVNYFISLVGRYTCLDVAGQCNGLNKRWFA